MPTVKEITTYKFSELSDKAKEKARDWYRDGALDHDWWDAVYDDALSVAVRLGIEITSKAKPPGERAPAIYFSGFCQQGSGACFEGYWRHKEKPHRTSPDAIFRKKVLNTNERYTSFEEAIKDYAPNDEELNKIAKELDTYTNYACGIRQDGNYSHEHTMQFTHYVTNEHGDDDDTDENDTTSQVEETLRDFARWIYSRLEQEHDYLLSDEVVDESIAANEYEFDEDGDRV